MSMNNLEIHGLLGLRESFGSSFSCSRYVMPKDECRTEIVVDEKLLRNMEDHKFHIKENVPNFNMFKHVVFDYAHDFLEGFLRYEMAEYLNILIFEYRVLSYNVF